MHGDLQLYLPKFSNYTDCNIKKGWEDKLTL